MPKTKKRTKEIKKELKKKELKTKKEPEKTLAISVSLTTTRDTFKSEGNSVSEALLKIPKFFVKSKGTLNIKTGDKEITKVLSLKQMRRFFRGDKIRKVLLAKRLGLH